MLVAAIMYLISALLTLCLCLLPNIVTDPLLFGLLHSKARFARPRGSK